MQKTVLLDVSDAITNHVKGHGQMKCVIEAYMEHFIRGLIDEDLLNKAGNRSFLRSKSRNRWHLILSNNLNTPATETGVMFSINYDEEGLFDSVTVKSTNDSIRNLDDLKNLLNVAMSDYAQSIEDGVDEFEMNLDANHIRPGDFVKCIRMYERLDLREKLVLEKRYDPKKRTP